jgi:hypothetical protein
LNTTLTPHSMIHGDACFAYFNKIWGILFFITAALRRSRRCLKICCILTKLVGLSVRPITIPKSTGSMLRMLKNAAEMKASS